MIKKHKGKLPVIGKNVYIAESAIVIGEVELGDAVGIWPSVTIRGDENYIKIGRGTNVQDNTVIHVTGNPSHPTIIGEEVTIGHGAIIHGATIKRRALIGMGAIVLDGAVVEEEAMVGAGAVVPPGMVVKSHTLVLGAPAKERRKLRDSEIEHLGVSAENYMRTAREYIAEEDCDI